MIIDGIIKTVEHQQLVAIILEKIFVAHSALYMFANGCEPMIALRQDITLLIKAVDFIHAFGGPSCRWCPIRLPH